MPQGDNKRQLYAAAASVYSSCPAKQQLATYLLDKTTITPQGQWISPFVDVEAAADRARLPAHSLLQLLHGDACFILQQHGPVPAAPAHAGGPAHPNLSTRITLNPSALLTASCTPAAPPWTALQGLTGPGYAGGTYAAASVAGEQLALAVVTLESCMKEDTTAMHVLLS